MLKVVRRELRQMWIGSIRLLMSMESFDERIGKIQPDEQLERVHLPLVW